VQGYYGAAAGKGKQVAKNEFEKLDLKNMTAREAVYKAAKMYKTLR
jgi:20S proteasome subunit alpha 7